MFEKSFTIDKLIADDVKRFMNENIVVSTDHSRYAPGRNRGWLNHEGPLTMSRSFKPVPCPERLWDWLCRVWKKSGYDNHPELGLAAYGDKGISLHRDATYAHEDALLVNLGGVTWAYEPTRNVTEPEYHTFDSGEVIRFNCKHRHAAIDPSSDRWSIVLWRVSDRRRDEFEEYKLQI